MSEVARVGDGGVVEYLDHPARMSNDTLKMQVGGDHYLEHGNMQPWVIIDHYKLNYWEGNALKYLLRSTAPRYLTASSDSKQNPDGTYSDAEAM